MSSERTARGVLIALTILAVALLVLLIHPFAAALFIGAVLAGAFHSGYEALVVRLKGKRSLAAALFTVVVVLVLLLPIAWITLFVASEVVDGVNYVRTTLQSEGVSGLIDDLPRPLAELARKGLERLPRGAEQIQEFAGSQTGRAAAFMGGFLVATGGIVVHVALMLIAFFFFLMDGPKLIDWISHAAPLRPEQTRELLGEFRKVSVAVLFSSVANAAIQAAAALAGYLLAAIPQPFFFAFVTFIFAFVPAVGAWAIVVLTGGLAFLRGHTQAAVFLAAWGAVVVGLADHWVKPLLMRGRVEIHGAIIFFALLGGLANFGAVGLLAGPLIVAFFLAVVRMCQREFGTEL
jgi:predicted PurR-regulated permease PerM